MNSLKVLLYLFLLLLVVACYPDRPHKKEIEVAYSMIEEHPDTAMYVLQKINDPQRMSKRDYMTYQLLLTYHQARVNEKLGEDLLSEQYYLEALAEAEKAEDYKFTGLVYTRLSELYIRMADYPKAFDMQRKAYSNYLLADSQRGNPMWYLLFIPVALLLVCLLILYRYSKDNRNLRKLIGKQEKQLVTTQKTMSEQKLELSGLKKDLRVMKEQNYNASGVVQKVRAINALPAVSKEKPALSDQEWNNYLTALDDYAGFVSSLKKTYPRLTDIDIRICALMREKISTAHISSVMSMTPETLSKRIQRIRNEKMNLSGSNMSLEVALHEL